MTLRDYDEGRRERHSLPLRWLLGLSGTVVAGTIVLTLTVIGTAYLGDRRGFPGPGQTSLVAHVVATVVALVTQIWAERRSGTVAVLGASAVLMIVAFLLWTQWWS